MIVYIVYINLSNLVVDIVIITYDCNMLILDIVIVFLVYIYIYIFYNKEAKF